VSLRRPSVFLRQSFPAVAQARRLDPHLDIRVIRGACLGSAAEVCDRDRVIIELRLLPDQDLQINRFPGGWVMAKDSTRRLLLFGSKPQPQLCLSE
jgi:hypothetical protein